MGDLAKVLRRWPVISALAALLFLGIMGLLVWTYLSRSPFRQAERSLKLDLVVDAEVAINSYLERFPNDPQALLLAVRIERLRGNPIVAEKRLEEYKRIEGTTERYQMEWLLLRAMSGDLPDLEDGLQRSLEKNDPHSHLILEALVFVYVREWRFRHADYYVEKMLRREPDNVRALAWQGVIKESLRWPDAARSAYERVLELSPGHFDSRLRLANLLMREKNIPEASAHLKVLEQGYPDHPDVMFALVLCQSLQGNVEEAENILDRLLAKFPENPHALSQKGKLALDLVEQEKCFRRALKIDPNLVEARFGLFTCLSKQASRRKDAELEKKKYDETAQKLKALENKVEALEKFPKNPDLMVEVGSYLLSQDPPAGKELLYQALRLSPTHPKAHEILADYFARTNQPERAAYHRQKIRHSPSPK